jgi:hypothetical protein
MPMLISGTKRTRHASSPEYTRTVLDRSSGPQLHTITGYDEGDDTE